MTGARWGRRESGPAPLVVKFASKGSKDPDGSIASYEWNFHDGAVSAEPNPTHTYTVPRTYTATVIVTDNSGFKDMAWVVVRVTRDAGGPVPAK